MQLFRFLCYSLWRINSKYDLTLIPIIISQPPGTVHWFIEKVSLLAQVENPSRESTGKWEWSRHPDLWCRGWKVKAGTKRRGWMDKTGLWPNCCFLLRKVPINCLPASLLMLIFLFQFQQWYWIIFCTGLSTSLSPAWNNKLRTQGERYTFCCP